MKPLVYLSCFLISVSSVNAQSSVWRVSNGDNEVYLGGTCHILRKSDYPLPSEFDIAYDLADELVFEVDPEEVQSQEFAMRLMAESVYQDGRTLKSVLSAEAYEALAQQGQKSNLPIEILQNMKPGMAVMMVTIQELTKAGVSQDGVDFNYYYRALEDAKPIHALETAEFQLEIITRMGEGNESEFVLYSLQDLDNLDGYMDELIEAWRLGNTQAIEAIFIDEMKDFPEVYEQLLKDRNLRWIPQIEEMLRTEPTEYLLFGVGHIPGEDGILTLLAEKGYQIEQITAQE